MTGVGRSLVSRATPERAHPHIGLQAAPTVDHLAGVNLLGDEVRRVRGEAGLTSRPGTDLPKVDHLVGDLDDDVEIHVRLVVAPRTRPDVADLDGLNEIRRFGRPSRRAVSLVVRRVQGILHEGRLGIITLGFRPIVGVDEGLGLLALEGHQPERTTFGGVGVYLQVRTLGGFGDDGGSGGNVEAAGKRELHGSFSLFHPCMG